MIWISWISPCICGINSCIHSVFLQSLNKIKNFTCEILVAVGQQKYPYGEWDYSISSKLSIWLSLCRWKWSYIINLALWLYPGNSNWSALLEAFAAKEIFPFSDLSVLSFLQKQIPVHLSSAWRHLFYQWMRHIFKGEEARKENQPFCLGEVQKKKVEDL